ncbi:M48 family metallopeptidase [Sphingomonas sp. NFR15]|uniref:M48 family metallopeptidase n=1 Tax=Sphingomonas sp. NFR15 TaxID=1566282 RepID=UPI000885E120|nr:M48 family metallopeptidase [Sphingomonas sp. NFR15]SDA28894.1 Putative Zn-dependent protease, contains TPR repeats [Sphingomonas sp. NFR15]
MPRLRRFALLGAAAVLGIAASVPRPPLPPYAGAYEPQSVDERGLWMQLDEAERTLRDSAFVVKDATLTGYVRAVLCRTVGVERCMGTRVYVIRDPEFNASMTPNGTLVVNTGLFMRVRDEAELAAVLGHEFAHFEQRHGLHRFQHSRSMTDVAAWMGVIAASGASYQIRSAAVDVSHSTIGSIFAFNRDEEREADMLGAKYMLAAGYDPKALPDIWTRAMDEADATSFGRKQKSHRYDRLSFFASHPTNLERATYLRGLVAGMGQGDTGHDALRTAIKPLRGAFIADQLKLNDFGGTEYLFGQLAGDAWDAELLRARGDLYRARGNPRDLVSAAGFYAQAIALDPADADAYRGLGLARLRGGDAQGAEALKRYLALRPDAPDRAMIQALLP